MPEILPVIIPYERCVLIDEKQTVFGKNALAGSDQLPSELCIFRVVCIIGRQTALDREQILSADLAHIADILNQRISAQVEAQIDEVGQSVETLKLHRLVKLIFLIAEEAVHPFSEVVDFIEVNESVLEAAEFLGEYDLGHIQFKGRNILGVDSFECRTHFLFCAGKAEGCLTVSVFDFQFNHGKSPLQRRVQICELP